jgi:alkylhydroperoxidase family enzyme
MRRREPSQLEALERGQDAPGLFDNSQRAAFAFADELVDGCSATHETLTPVPRMFSPRQVLEP